MKWLAAWVVLAVVTTAAHASPKVAIVPIDGDTANGQLTGVIVEEAASSAKVSDADDVAKAMHALAIDATPDARELKKLRGKLKVDVVVTGKVEKDDDRLKLTLTATGRSGKAETFVLHFTKSSAKPFRAQLAAALDKHIAGVTTPATDGDGDEDEDKPKRPPVKVKDRDDDKPAKPVRPVRSIAKREDSDDDDTKVHKRHHRSALEASRNQLTQGAIWLDAGAAGLRRTLTYGTAAAAPPPVGTFGATGQVDGAYYSGDDGSGFGVVGTVRQTLGVAIAVPGTTLTCPIDEGLYTLGARYRVPFGGDSSLAFGASYWRYRYIANRAKLGAAPGQLDMPDVDYSAIAPAAEIKYALSPGAAVFGSLMVPIIMSTGPVSTMGGGGSLSFAVDAGIDFALAEHYGLRLEGIFDQVGLQFDKTNAVAQMRGLSTAADRTMGVVATLALLY